MVSRHRVFSTIQTKNPTRHDTGICIIRSLVHVAWNSLHPSKFTWGHSHTNLCEHETYRFSLSSDDEKPNHTKEEGAGYFLEKVGGEEVGKPPAVSTWAERSSVRVWRKKKRKEKMVICRVQLTQRVSRCIYNQYQYFMYCIYTLFIYCSILYLQVCSRKGWACADVCVGFPQLILLLLSCCIQSSLGKERTLTCRLVILSLSVVQCDRERMDGFGWRRLPCPRPPDFGQASKSGDPAEQRGRWRQRGRK